MEAAEIVYAAQGDRANAVGSFTGAAWHHRERAKALKDQSNFVAAVEQYLKAAAMYKAVGEQGL